MKNAVSFWRWCTALGFAGLAGVWISACGSTGGEGSSGSGAGVTSGAGGNGGSLGVGGSTFGCDPACEAPQECSVAGVCIDPGGCAADGDCDVGKVCDTGTKMCVPGGGCGAQEAKVEAIPPNLLIVLDRSCSMTDKVGNTTKWAIAVQAINQMTTDFNGKIRFGLTLFPDLDAMACKQAAVAIPVAQGTEMKIQELLTASLVTADPYFPDGPCETNIDTAMDQANKAEPAFNDADRDSYALLITDGKQSDCVAAGGDAGTLKIIGDLFKLKGVPTFVLGFGSGVDPAQMNKFANAGGAPSSGANKYYDASDQASLDQALKTIAEKTLSCAYALEKAPPDVNEIYVFFNNEKPVQKDSTHMGGWDYDAATNQVVFYGATCDELKSGAVTDLDIVLGCNEPTPN